MDGIDEIEKMERRNKIELSLRFNQRSEDWLKLTEEEINLFSDGGILTLLDSTFFEYASNYDEVKAYLIDKLAQKQLFFGDNDPEYVNLLLDRAVLSEQKEYFFWPVRWAEEPRDLIRAGLFPTSLNINSKWFSDYLNGVDLETIEFWWSTEVVDILTKLKTESRWVYRSLNAWKEIALTTASSVGLRTFTGDRDLYKESKRPLNDRPYGASMLWQCLDRP